jgi:hypothetical protein
MPQTWFERHPWIVFAALLAMLSLIFVIAYYASRSSWEAEAQGATGEPPSSKWDDQLDELERQAIGDAFKKHIGQLYSVWVTDNYQPRIPPKALVGARNARDAYIRSMEAIEKRRQAPRR